MGFEKDVRCPVCRKLVKPVARTVPKYGGYGGVVTELRCPFCNTLISSREP